MGKQSSNITYVSQDQFNKDLDESLNILIEDGADDKTIKLYIDDYKSRFAVKKKDGTKPNSTSTSVSTKQDSEQTNGSSGSQEFEYKPVYDERGREVKIKNAKGELVPYMEKVPKGFASSTEEREVVRQEQKQKASKPIVTSSNLKKYQEATKVNEEEKASLQQEVNDEFYKRGFWNGITDGAKKGFNFLTDVVTTIGSFGSETESSIRMETDSFAKEKKQAEQELISSKQPVTPETIAEKAKEIKLKKKVEGLVVDKNNEFLSNLSEEEIKSLNLERVKQYKTLSDKDKYIATQSEILKNNFERDTKDYATAVAIIKKNKEQGIETNQSLIDFAIEKENSLKEKLDEVKTLESEYISNKENIGSAEEEVDFLKRNYDTADKIKTLAKIGFGDIYNSLSNKLPLMVSDLDQAIFEPLRPGSSEGVLSDDERQQLIDNSIDWENAKELAKSKVKKDVDFENLSLSNFGQFFAQELGTQLPIFAQMAMPGGIVSIGMTSAFDKYGKMEQESNNIAFEFNGKQFYGFEKENGEIVDSLGNTYDPKEVNITSIREADKSTANKFLTSVTFGTAEAVLGAMPTKNIFGRALSSFSTSGERTLFRQSVKEFVKAKGTSVLNDTATEVVSEGATQIIQNIADISSGNKNIGIYDGVDHAAVSAGMLSFFMSASPAVAGLALKPFSESKENKQVNENLQEIFALQSQLNNPEITSVSKTAIENRISELEKTNSDVLDKIASRTKGISKETFEAIKDTNKKQEILILQASEISKDNRLDKEVKKKIISDLESQFNKLEEKRNKLASGKSTILDALSDSQSVQLREKAANELIAEEKSKGKIDSEINFTEEQINKKAIELYNQSKLNEAKQEATITETKQETQPQAEIQKTEQEVLETPIVENETAPSQVDNVDGNVQPGNNVVEPSGTTEQENNQAGDVQAANNSRNVEVKREIKIADKGQSYTVEKTDLGLVITDKKGKKPSKVTERKILDEYSKTINFTQGQRVDDSFESSEETYIDDIASKSQNASEIAEAIAYVEQADMNERKVDPIQVAIARAVGEKSVEKSSFTNINDRNNITQSIALQYFAPSGKGKGLDQIAMEVEVEIYGDYNANNPRISEEDIANFMVDNPKGSLEFLNRNKNEALEKLRTAFTDVTGLPAKTQFIEAAIKQNTDFKNEIFNGNSLYLYSDEDLLSLQKQREEFEKSIEYGKQSKKQSEAANEIAEGINNQPDNKDGKQTPGIQKDSGTGYRAENKPEVTPEEKQIQNNKKDEFDNTDLEDDTEVQAQGFFNGSKQNERDLALSDNGPVKLRFPFQKIFKRVWANTFKSNSGLSKESGEVVRSRNRILATYTDHINQEAIAFDKIIKDVKKLFPKEFNQKLIEINNYLSGDKNADISFLNQEQIDKLDYFRDRIDSLSKSLITLLEDKMSSMKNKQAIESTKELIETIKQNMGIYITRNYQIFSDDNYRDMITGDFENINKGGQLRIRNAINYLIREEGLTKDEATKSVAEYLAEIRRKKNDFFVQSSGNAVSNFFKKRKGIPKEFRELLGESKDPTYNYINTVYKISQYLGNIEYQYNLREHLINNQITSLEPKLGYEKIVGSSEGWRILNDIYVPVEFKEAFDDMQPLQTVESGFYKTWIKIAGIVKINKTVLSPTTAARNLLSGIFLGANSGHFFLLKPSSAANAWNQAWSTKKTQKELFNERQKLIKLGVLGDGANSGELMALLNDFSKEVDRMINKNAFEMIFEKAKDLYAFGDDFYKVSGFYIERDRLIKSGLSELEAENKAAYRINNGYPTYSYLPKNIQRLRRLPLIGTFVSFPYETIRSTKNNINFIKEDLEEGRTKMAYQRAAGMIVANATLGGLNMLTMAMLGLTDDDDNAIRDMLPEWQKNSKLIYLGTKNEKPIFIDGTALFPSEVIFKPISILLEKRKGRELEDKLKIATNEVLSPYISKDISFKTLTEIFENENEFNEKIYLSDNLLEGVFNESEKILNYLMRQAGPGVYNNVTEFLRANEIKPNFFGDKFSAYGKEYTNQEALLGLLGFRISTLNYNAAMSSYAYQVKQSETEDKSSSNKLVKTSKKLTSDEIKGIVEDYAKYHNENYKQMVNIVSSGKKLGMSNMEIKKSLKLSKISDNDIRDLLKGKVPRLSPMSTQTKSNFKQKLKINYKGKDINEILNNFESNFRKMNIEIRQYNRTKIE